MKLSSTWPLSPYDKDFEAKLRKSYGEEFDLLTVAGQKSLSVFLHSAMDQGFLATNIGRGTIPGGVRQKLESLNLRMLELTGREDFHDTLLREDLNRVAARIRASLLPRRAPAGFHRANSRQHFQREVAWPFFPPAAALVVFQIYKTMALSTITHGRIYSIASTLLGSQSAKAVERQILRLRKSRERAKAIRKLVQSLKSTYRNHS
jgi:hypothetical protein